MTGVTFADMAGHVIRVILKFFSCNCGLEVWVHLLFSKIEFSTILYSKFDLAFRFNCLILKKDVLEFL